MSLSVLIKQKMRLKSSQLSPDQKKLLWDVMSRYKATPGFSYRRFFKEGFKDWEMQGVEKVKSDFLQTHSEISELMEAGTVGFYQAVVKAGLREQFLLYMEGLGMGRSQAYDKFGLKGETTFMDYERIGIISIFKEYLEEIGRKAVI